MALKSDITEALDALNKIERELSDALEAHYERGTRVSFRKFTFWGVQDIPVLTGTIMWVNPKLGDIKCIFARIQLDPEHCPCAWPQADCHNDLATIDILNPEYDITIIA
jgi:hypothetical protein